MYTKRNGQGTQFHSPGRAQCQLQTNKKPKPVFICCGSVGLVFTAAGAIVLGIGKKRQKKDNDYTFILIGSMVLGIGFIITLLAIFLSLSWSSLASTDYEGRSFYRRSTRRRRANTTDSDAELASDR